MTTKNKQYKKRPQYVQPPPGLKRGDLIIPFNRANEPFGWLGNMASFPLTWQGEIWLTPEALFQALRYDEGHPIRAAIREQTSPMIAKRVAKKARPDMIVRPLSEQDRALMSAVLQEKLVQHPALVGLLRSTGNSYLIEDCTRRPHGSGKFWGAALEDGEWIGENWLGRLWMDLRKICCTT